MCLVGLLSWYVLDPGSQSREGLSYQIVPVLFHWAKHKRAGEGGFPTGGTE